MIDTTYCSFLQHIQSDSPVRTTLAHKPADLFDNVCGAIFHLTSSTNRPISFIGDQAHALAVHFSWMFGNRAVWLDHHKLTSTARQLCGEARCIVIDNVPEYVHAPQLAMLRQIAGGGGGVVPAEALVILTSEKGVTGLPVAQYWVADGVQVPPPGKAGMSELLDALWQHHLTKGASTLEFLDKALAPTATTEPALESI